MLPLILLLALLLLLLSSFSFLAASSSDRPNVGVILADDQGSGDLSHHGDQSLNTPALASEGAQFTNFYLQPTWVSTPAEFQTRDYYPRSGVFGKWHSATQAPYHPNARGFDGYYGFASEHRGSHFDALLDDNCDDNQSYVTDFAPLELGSIKREEGTATLKRTTQSNKQGAYIEFRLLLVQSNE